MKHEYHEGPEAAVYPSSCQQGKVKEELVDMLIMGA
jgi:hypothetical protein